MPKSIDDLALETFSGKTASEGERQKYYKELVERQKSGGKLDREETEWLDKAGGGARTKQTARLSTMGPRGTNMPAPAKTSVDTLMDAYNKAREKPLDLEIGPVTAKPAKPDVALDIGPAQVSPQVDLDIGPVQIRNPAQVTQNRGIMRSSGLESIANKPKEVPPGSVAGLAVQNMAAADRAGAPSFKYGYQHSLEPKAEVSVGDAGTFAKAAPQYRTTERRPDDVMTDDTDKFGQDALEQRYGEHLKAMQDNRDADGMPTDKFPEGYFDGMSKQERKNIEKGVQELMTRSHGLSI